MKVTSLKLKNEQYGRQWFEQVEDRWDYSDMQSNPAWREGWISMDCALYNAAEDRIYLGITSFAADIFKAYDRRSGQFIDLGFRSIANPFDAKFHRALVQGGDGCLYAGIALLHDVDCYYDAPGGAIVKYNPSTGSINKAAVPLPHVYIQSIVLDRQRDTIYCLCFAPEYLVSYNLHTGEVANLGLLGSGYGGMAQGENIVLDDDGCVWSSWSLTRAWQPSPGKDAIRLCKYDPQVKRMIFFQTGLPMPDGSYGYAKVEGLFNLGDGAVYASGANGSLYRIDTATGEATYLFTPTTDRRSRLSSLVKAGDDFAYGMTGRDGQCELLRVNFKDGTFDKLGEIRDAEGNSLWQCHDIVMAGDGTLYICENDNPYRSSYLWEVKL